MSIFTDFQYNQLRIDQLIVIDFLLKTIDYPFYQLNMVRMIPVLNGVTNRSLSLSVNATPCTSEQSERSYFQAIQITIFPRSLDRELSISKHAPFKDTYPVD